MAVPRRCNMVACCWTRSSTAKGRASAPADSIRSENPDSTETVFAEGKTSTENGDDRSQPAVPGPSGSSSSSNVVKLLAASGSLAESGSKRSIQTMEEKSETYKSLFTSHSSAKRTKAQTSNWVTHTPYHF